MAYRDKAKEHAYRLRYQRKWMKVRAARWRDADCCTKCGTPVTKFKMCLECRERIARWHEARVARKPKRFCVIHSWVEIRLKGCRTCGTLIASRGYWDSRPTFQRQVREQLLLGWQSTADVVKATGLSTVRVRSALGVFRRHKARAGVRLESRTGWQSKTGRPVCFYRLVKIMDATEAA